MIVITATKVDFDFSLQKPSQINISTKFPNTFLETEETKKSRNIKNRIEALCLLKIALRHFSLRLRLFFS